MANNDQVSQEYLLIKCFLYKYTPPFTAQADVTASLSTFKPFAMPLDNTSYFTKYDISAFVSSYNFQQNINETTYSWSVELMDQALSYASLNQLKVLPPNGNTMRGGLSFSQDLHSISLLSEYEANANNFKNNDTNEFGSNTPILDAKAKRGENPGFLIVQNSNLNTVLSTKPGLRLSDLMQEYDFISLFLYKSTTPLSAIHGQVVPNGFSPTNNRFYIFNYAFTDTADISVTNAFNESKFPSLTDADLQYETVLLTKMPTGNTLFSNEFNGFVMKKSITSVPNQVDKVIVSGNGWSRLFGSTRRAVKPSLFENSLYQTGQVLGLDDVSAMETVYAGSSIGKIVRDLFDLVYKIDFKVTGISAINESTTPTTPNTVDSTNGTNLVVTTTTTTTTGSSTTTVAPPSSDFTVSTSDTTVSGLSQIGAQPTAFTNPVTITTTSVTATPSTTEAELSGTYTSPQIDLSLVLGDSYFSTTGLIVGNAYPANLFTLPPYLLSSVMKLRNFAYIEPLEMPASTEFVSGAIAAAARATAFQSTGQANAEANAEININPILVQVPPLTFQESIENYNTSNQVINYTGTHPVLFDPEVQSLVAYFQFLDAVYENFNPELQTPYEIFDQIRQNAFIEIFEQPNGQFIIRAPQYNNMAVSVDGRSDIALIKSSNLNILSSAYTETVENLVTKLFALYTPNISPLSVLQKFGYCDGKLLIQNGLLETDVAANPNAATASLSNDSVNSNKTTGIFGWAEYLMELNNARLKTGTIACDLDNTIQVGQTFIDETRFKFSYIVGVSKQVVVGGTASMSLSLSYVRDAVPNSQTVVANGDIAINVDLLPVLADIEKSFTNGAGA